MSMPSTASDNAGRAEGEWQRHIDQTSAAVRACAAQVVSHHAADCVARFYAVLLDHPNAAPFLSLEAVDSGLSASLAKWLQQLFSAEIPDAAMLAATQRRVGAAHARIHVPIHVVMHGARLIKSELRSHIFNQSSPTDVLVKTMAYVADMIDIAIEFMSQSFVRDAMRDAEKDEAFRLMSLGQDMSLEREIQRSALLDWQHKLLFGSIYGEAAIPTPLANSAFGLWLYHKGEALFHGRTEIAHIHRNVREIDLELIPSLLADNPPPLSLMKDIQARMEEIHTLIDQLFKSAEAIEGARDPLTKTLGRRFLPTILSREISVSLRRDVCFSVLMIDIDNFKSMNESFGHVGGDSILRNAAEILVSACRPSDFIFRYGGEEFLILLIETSQDAALQTAEHIRQTVEQSPIATIAGTDVQITVSIGVATFDGHPDYAHLIEAADKALYVAKSEGRNRCRVA